MSLPEEGDSKPTEAKLQGYAAVLSIGSTRCKANMLGTLHTGGAGFHSCFHFTQDLFHLTVCL